MPGFKMTVAGGRGGGARPPRQKVDPSSIPSCFGDETEAPKKLGHLAERPPEVGAGPAAGADTTAATDSLDVFMAGIDEAVAKQPGDGSAFNKKAFAGWEELQAEDPVVSYCEAYEKESKGGGKTKPDGGLAVAGAGGPLLEEEEDGAAAAEEAGEEEEGPRAKSIEPLPRVDHSAVPYEEVQLCFYEAHEEVRALSAERVQELRQSLRIAVTGSDAATVAAGGGGSGAARATATASTAPCVSFAHMGLPEAVMAGIRRHGYSTPTPIQAQAIPLALSGRDVIGVAETGSGKTVAYLIPLLVHASAQPRLRKDEGPIGLVLCPTRELAIQVERETYKFNKALGLRSTTLVGGLSKYQQFKDVKAGCEVVIGTPGRIIDIIQMKGFNLRRCTFVVLDEADRMMQMGFEFQIRSIVQNVRPSRQTLLFSATFPPRIERISRDLLRDPMRITIGELGQAAENISQFVQVLSDEEEKWPWLSSRVPGFLASGQLLVFVKSKQGAEDLAESFAVQLHMEVVVLHGDLDQDGRMRRMEAFRKRRASVLVATDLAARGLDVPSIRTVVSYDAARDIETHTHRVGRTGRAGAAGEAYTLLTADKQGRKMAALLVDHLRQVKSRVSEELLALAMAHPPFRASHLATREGAVTRPAGAGEEPGSATVGALPERARSRSRTPPPGSPASPPPTP